MDSWVSLGGKESRSNQLKSWQSQWSNWRPFGQKAEILPTVPNMPAQDIKTIIDDINNIFIIIVISLEQILIIIKIKLLAIVMVITKMKFSSKNLMNKW